MTKSQLIKQIYENQHSDKKLRKFLHQDIELIINHIITQMIDAVKGGRDIKLTEFGHWSFGHKKMLLPYTCGPDYIERITILFRQSEIIRAAVNKIAYKTKMGHIWTPPASQGQMKKTCCEHISGLLVDVIHPGLDEIRTLLPNHPVGIKYQCPIRFQ